MEHSGGTWCRDNKNHSINLTARTHIRIRRVNGFVDVRLQGVEIDHAISWWAQCWNALNLSATEKPWEGLIGIRNRSANSWLSIANEWHNFIIYIHSHTKKWNAKRPISASDFTFYSLVCSCCHSIDSWRIECAQMHAEIKRNRKHISQFFAVAHFLHWQPSENMKLNIIFLPVSRAVPLQIDAVPHGQTRKRFSCVQWH